MARSSTTWVKGVSGNPKGRPPNATGRAAIRRALAEPVGKGSDEKRLDKWAREIVESAATLEQRLDVLRWLEGSSPPPEPAEPTLNLIAPRIVIPGSPADSMPASTTTASLKQPDKQGRRAGAIQARRRR